MATTGFAKVRQCLTTWSIRRTSARPLPQQSGVVLVAGVCLACAVVLVLWGSLAGCSSTSTPGPTNENPLSVLRADILAAGITPLEGAVGPSEGVREGELYLRVLAPEGQDASSVADTLLHLTQKYKEQLHLRWLHVVIASSEGFYDHTFDLTSSSSSSG